MISRSSITKALQNGNAIVAVAGQILQRLRTLAERRVAASGYQAMRRGGRLLSHFVAERDRWFLWVPVLMGVGVGAYFSLANEPQLWPALTLLCVVGGVTLWLSRREDGGGIWSVLLRALLCIVVGFAAAKIRTERVSSPMIEREVRYTTVEGRIKKILAGSDGFPRLIIEPDYISKLSEDKTPRGIRLSYRGGRKDISAGMTVRVRATIMPPPTPVMPYGFDFARQSFFDRIGGVGYIVSNIEDIEVDRARSLFDQLSYKVAKVRAALTMRLRTSLPGYQGALAAALITGDRSGIPPDKVQALREAGLAHLLAISGLHMGMAGWAIFGLVRGSLAAIPRIALRYPIKKIAAGVGLIGASAYLVLSGAPISAQRAYLMLGLVFVAIMLDRPAFTLRMVALAAMLILLLQPESMMEAGFQMSFAACTVLVSAYEARRRWLAGRPRKGGFTVGIGEPRNLVHWFGSSSMRYVSGILLTSFLAGMATAPFAAFHFNQFANYGLIANLFAVPMMGAFVMPWAVLALVLMPFGLEDWPLAVMGFGIDQILFIAEGISSRPGSLSILPSWSGWALVMVVGGSLWMLLWSKKWRLGGGAVIGLGLIMAINEPLPDLIVARDGKNIGVRTSEGMLDIMKGGRRNYTVDTWQRRTGLDTEDKPPKGEDAPFKCDKLGCTYHLADGRILAHIADARAFPEDCRIADIIVSNLWVPKTCDTPGLVIGMMDVRRGGAHVVRFLGENYGVTTAEEVRGKRPWSLGG